MPDQGAQGHGEGQSDHLPVLDPVESSDEDDPEEDTSSDLPSPAHPIQVGPPALVDAPEEDEDHMEYDEDEIEDMTEEEIINEFGDQFNDAGTHQLYFNACSYSDLFDQLLCRS